MSAASSSRPRPRRVRRAPDREQALSPFTRILQRLLDHTPGSVAVALVDSEGETVDYAGALDTFDVKVTAAHLQLVASEVQGIPRHEPLRQLVIRGTQRSYVLRKVQLGYSLVLILHRHAAFAASERALHEADQRLAAEANWPLPPSELRWFGVDVETQVGERTRPRRLRAASRWHDLEVMGSMVGLTRRERGFRVRLLTSGAEMLLVRERLGRWFTDEKIEE